MKSLVILLSMFLALHVTAKTQETTENFASLNFEYVNLENEKFDIEQVVFEDLYNITNEVKVEDVAVIEIDEEVEIDFNTKNHLPERFNANKGMHDIDWNTVELVEIEEDIELGMNTKISLPEIKCKSNANAIIVSRL